MKNLDESRITQPLVAALTTGLLRAVLSEIIANLPPHVTVFTATTDGWLSTATEAEARAAARRAGREVLRELARDGRSEG